MNGNTIDIKVVLSGAEKMKQGLGSIGSGAKNSIGQFMTMGAVLAASVVAGFSAAAAAAAKFGERIGQFDQLAGGFKRNFGNMDKAMEQLRKTSRGTISDFDLMQTANRAALLGVTSDAGKLSKIMVTARIRGKELGISTTQAFNDIVTGIGRGSPLILDNLGIKIPEALQKTMEGMNETQKTAALVNFVIKDGQKLMKQYGKDTLSTADKSSILQATLQNLGDKTLKMLQPVLGGILDVAIPIVNNLTEFADSSYKVSQGFSKFIETGKAGKKMMSGLRDIFGLTKTETGQLKKELHGMWVFFETQLKPAGQGLVGVFKSLAQQVGPRLKETFGAIQEYMGPGLKLIGQGLDWLNGKIRELIDNYAKLNKAQKELNKATNVRQSTALRLEKSAAYITKKAYEKGYRGPIMGLTPKQLGELAKQYNIDTSVTRRTTKKAVGGSVQRGRSYVVGERGREMFTPETSGKIVPNGKGQGGSPIFNIYTQAGESAMNVANAIAFKLQYV